MDRNQILLNTLAKQRNDALDAFVNATADITLLQAELAEAKKRITELEAQLPKPEATDGQPTG